MKIYNQNIWGNFSSPEQCIANRNVLIKELIYEYNPDFCCFQECNPYTSRSGDTPIQDLLSKDFDEVSAKHSERNYTPIFYKRSEFNVKDCGYFPFKGLNDLNSKSVTWGVFEEKTNKKTIAVISTHFWWQSCNETNVTDAKPREGCIRDNVYVFDFGANAAGVTKLKINGKR